MKLFVVRSYDNLLNRRKDLLFKIGEGFPCLHFRVECQRICRT